MEKELCGFKTKKRLLLHTCCAPCSSYVLEYLTGYSDITVFFYNPNITDPVEYKIRADGEQRLIGLVKHENSIVFIEGEYEPDKFAELSRGLEDLPEGGERCIKCYRLRLEAAARYMSEHRGEFDYFCTTLTVSPHKNAAKVNEIGAELAERYGVSYLPSDFKKRGGYLRSVELSNELGLYRQNFCGCEFSRRFSNQDRAKD